MSKTYPKNRGAHRFQVAVSKSMFTLLDEYVDSRTKLNFSCPIHGRFTQSPTQFYIATGCKECAYDMRSNENFKNYENIFLTKARAMHPTLDFSESVYVDSITEINVRCPIHGYFTNIPKYIIQNTGCKKCSPKSKGEQSLISLLDRMNINYIREYTFDNCRGLGGLPLRFDFYIPSRNTLIEFDGIQHFIEATGAWAGTTAMTRAHDEIKNKYCYDNGIDLFRIPYSKISRIYDILLHLRICCKI